jgi:formylglycine-generating enzyme required for sulfatase activity
MRSTLLPSTLAAFLLVTSAAVPPMQAQTAAGSTQAYRETIPGTLVAFEMAPVPGGTVTVGGKTVTVAPFLIGRTEVTWDMYDVFELGLDVKAGGGADAVARPSRPYGAPDYGWGHAGYPAISIAFPAAQAFAEWLSAKTGKKYRLPTEAEWTLAAQLAAKGRADAGAIAWHDGNADAKTHPVGTKKPDALGLFDLFGNAAEWVTTGDDSYVTRGGSFRDPDKGVGPEARSVQDESWNARDPQLPKSRWWLSDGPFVGFRLVREP